MLKPLKKKFKKNARVWFAIQLKHIIPYFNPHPFTFDPQMTLYVNSIFFSWLCHHTATFYLRNHCLLVFHNIFCEDYRQRISKLMLHSSIITIQKYSFFAGWESGWGSGGIEVSACRKTHFVTSSADRRLGKTGVGRLPTPLYLLILRSKAKWFPTPGMGKGIQKK